jgi:hypothetical protein
MLNTTTMEQAMVNTLYSQQQAFTKRRFDPTKKSDLAVYKTFITTGSWGDEPCPFQLEWPSLNVPNMIERKISEYAVRNI